MRRRSATRRREVGQAAISAPTLVPPEPAAPARDQSAVLADLAAVHARFDAGEMTFEDFEVTKQRLTEQLEVR